MKKEEIIARMDQLNAERKRIEETTRILVERFVNEVCGGEFYVPYFYPGHFEVNHKDQELPAFNVYIDYIDWNDQTKAKMEVNMAGKSSFEVCKGSNYEKEYLAFADFLRNVEKIKDTVTNCYISCNKMCDEYRHLMQLRDALDK